MYKESKIIIVTNRLPLRFEATDKGIKAIPSEGGITTGVGAIYPKHERHLWIGWPGIVVDKEKEEKEIEAILKKERQSPVFLSGHAYDNYYNGYCNQVLWPAFHDFDHFIVHSTTFWKSYVHTNKKFCDLILATYTEGDIIWVHDFHLMLLPLMLRQQLPNAKIGFFLHIPFPSFKELLQIPEYLKLIEGVLGADLIGFSIPSYKRNFIEALKKAGYNYSDTSFAIDNRPVTIDSFPIGIDAKKYCNLALSEQVHQEATRRSKSLSNDTLILSIDRLDYIKGIPNKIRAFELFLKKNPLYIGKIQLLLIVVPSRESIHYYKIIKLEIEKLVARVNKHYRQASYQPIIYNYNAYSLIEISSLYKMADIMLITSVKDGMNLVSKEFAASKADANGVLILSEATGAANELKEAVLINPNSIEDMVRGIETAMQMTPEEQQRRMRILQENIHTSNIYGWNQSFLSKLAQNKPIPYLNVEPDTAVSD